MEASAFGHGHCAVKATFAPSGVDVWQPMHCTSVPSCMSEVLVEVPHVARTFCSTCDVWRAEMTLSSPTWNPSSCVAITLLSKAEVAQKTIAPSAETGAIVNVPELPSAGEPGVGESSPRTGIVIGVA